ncbi:MAG: cupin-like domain-containing protein [Gammaproteobacteria bacterium]|nr:cupin-like domain-containing protein [Gammaproteobacteria bacterium]
MPATEAVNEMNVQELDRDFDAALSSRTPFVVRGAAGDWPARSWTPDKLQAAIGANGGNQYWHHLPRDQSLAEDMPCPDWLSAHWQERAERLSLERPPRFWEAREGHQTPWHYDGNALDVVNVQLTGSKLFTLAPPGRELPWIRFLPVSTLAFDDADIPTRQVVLNAGDLLYIPRFWSHRVRSLESVNRNVNWVWTDADFEPDSAVAVREAERLAAVGKLDGSGRLGELLTAYEAESLRKELQSYAGCRNADLVGRMLETVVPERVDARIEFELASQSSDEFIARLDARARSLFVREMFGPAVSAGLVAVAG